MLLGGGLGLGSGRPWGEGRSSGSEGGEGDGVGVVPGGGGVGAAGDDGEESGPPDLVEVEAVVAEGVERVFGVDGVVVAE